MLFPKKTGLLLLAITVLFAGCIENQPNSDSFPFLGEGTGTQPKTVSPQKLTPSSSIGSNPGDFNARPGPIQPGPQPQPKPGRCVIPKFDLNQTFSALLNSSESGTGWIEFDGISPPNYSFLDLNIPASAESCYYYKYSTSSAPELIHPKQKVWFNGDAKMDLNYSVKDLIQYTKAFTYYFNFGNDIPLINLDFNQGGHAVIPFMGGRYKLIEWETGTSRIRLQNLDNPSEIFWVENGQPFGANPEWMAVVYVGGGAILKGVGLGLVNPVTGGIADRPLFPPNPLYSIGTHPAGFSSPLDFLQGSGKPKEGFAKLYFDGFEDANHSTIEFKKGVQVADMNGGTSYGAINFLNNQGNEMSLPMAITLQSTLGHTHPRGFRFNGTPHAYATDNFLNPSRIEIVHNICVDTIACPECIQYPEICENGISEFIWGFPDWNAPLAITDTDYNSTHVVDLIGRYTNRYNYFARRSAYPDRVWLTLVGHLDSNHEPWFEHTYGGYIDSLQYNAGDLFFLGTAVNDGNFSTKKDDFAHQISISDKRPIYYPDLFDFNGTQPGEYTGIYKTAVFRIRERMGTSDQNFPLDNDLNSFEIYIDTENGNSGTIDTYLIGSGPGKPNWSGPKSAIWYWNANQDLNFSEYRALPSEGPNYKKAFTDNGSRVILEDRNASFELPAERLPVQARLVVKEP